MTDNRKVISDLESFRFPFVDTNNKSDIQELINATDEIVKDAETYSEFLKGLLE